jgi:hypothetical protein
VQTGETCYIAMVIASGESHYVACIFIAGLLNVKTVTGNTDSDTFNDFVQTHMLPLLHPPPISMHHTCKQGRI